MTEPVDRVPPEQLDDVVGDRRLREGVATAHALDQEEPGEQRVGQAAEAEEPRAHREDREDARQRQDLEGPGRRVMRSGERPRGAGRADQAEDGEEVLR